MSQINLKSYQQKAVDALVLTTKALLEKRPNQSTPIVFQAPTGSGKTVMVAKFIQDCLYEIDSQIPVCFVWLSIGTGNLHTQSFESLKNVFNGWPFVSLIEREFTGNRNFINSNEVVVGSWNKLWQKREGEWANVLMRDGEKFNFREVLENTKKQNKQIVLIIDESHANAKGLRASELKLIVGADVIVEMSATPSIDQELADDFNFQRLLIDTQELKLPEVNEKTSGLHIRIDPAVVIDQEMIKKQVIINEGLNDIMDDEMDSEQVVLEATYRKREQLKELFRQNGSDINPLVLIQIPDKEKGEAKKEAVEQFLYQKGIHEQNGKIAVWLSEEKTPNLEYIKDLDSPIEYLIFKQAIATGWDCPRSHILVKFREIKSETFEIQTVGRILRTPQQKHYEQEALNTGFVFTNQTDIIIKKEEYNPNIIKTLQSKRKNDLYEPINLTTYYKQRADYGDIKSDFETIFTKTFVDYFELAGTALFEESENKLKVKGVNFDLKKLTESVIVDLELSTHNFDKINGELKVENHTDMEISLSELQVNFDALIRNNLGVFTGVSRSIGVIKERIYGFFRRYLGSKSWENEMILVQKIFLSNRSIFETLLRKAVENYIPFKEEENRKRIEESEKLEIFEIAVEDYHNPQVYSKYEYRKFICEPCFLQKDRSEPEKSFEKLLDRSKEVLWWYKNGEAQQIYFGIKYEFAGKISTFYPDFLVKMTDGRIGIFETKDEHDREGFTYTKAKAEALAKYITDMNKSGHSLFGGIAIEKDYGWVYNNKAAYNWEATTKGDWVDWEEVGF